MRLQVPGKRLWGKYAGELLIVALGVALGLWATEWAADRRVATEVADARRALHDELTDNSEVIQFRKDAEACVRRRISDLRSWIQRQKAGERTPLPDEIGRPSSYAVLESVWDVSKAGEVAAKMPLEERRRYAAVYDVLESYSGHQQAEREVWFAINDFAGLSNLSATDLARLNGLLRRAAAIDEALNANYGTLSKDLTLLGVSPESGLPINVPARRTLCTSLDELKGAPSNKAPS